MQGNSNYEETFYNKERLRNDSPLDFILKSRNLEREKEGTNEDGRALF